MSSTENNPTTSTQKVLIGLICVIGVLFLIQLIVESGNSPPTSRNECLSSGNVWSSSANRCFDARDDDTTATTASAGFYPLVS
jgi:hypothetical protein